MEETNWIKQQNFTFAVALAYLKSRIHLQKDPLTLISQFRLFRNLEAREELSQVESEVNAYFDNLVNLQDSGFQMRDCLFVANYAQLNNLYSKNENKFNAVVLPRLKIVSKSNWYDEPELAQSVINLQYLEEDLHRSAHDYLTKNITFWLKSDYLIGILHYALTYTSDKTAREYLNSVNWPTQDLILQSLALAYFYQITPFNIVLQNKLSNLIYDKLNACEAITNYLALSGAIRKKSHSDSRLSLTDYEITLALKTLHKVNFHEILGVKNSELVEFEMLINYQREVQQGGIFISRRYLKFYEISVLISLLSILIFLMRIVEIPQIGSIAGPLIEVIVVTILFILGALIVRQKRPSEIIAKEIWFFGISWG